MSIITYEIRDDIGVIMLNNPPVNALSQALRAGLIQAIENAQKDASKALELGLIDRVSDDDLQGGAIAYAKELVSDQAESLKKFNNESPLSKEQMKNHDFMLNVAEIFGVIAYGQLVFEKAKIESIDEMVVDQLFSYLVRDINNFVIRQVNEYAGHFADGQKENLLDIIKEPHIDFEREESILVDYVFSLDGAYGSTYGEKINE